MKYVLFIVTVLQMKERKVHNLSEDMHLVRYSKSSALPTLSVVVLVTI